MQGINLQADISSINAKRHLLITGGALLALNPQY